MFQTHIQNSSNLITVEAEIEQQSRAKDRAQMCLVVKSKAKLWMIFWCFFVGFGLVFIGLVCGFLGFCWSRGLTILGLLGAFVPVFQGFLRES